MSWKKPYIEIPEEFDGLEWMEMNFSQEGYDTLYDGPRPNGSSRTWYIEELGKIQMPLNMGYWNFFDETNNIFDAHHLRLQHQPHIIDTHHCKFQYKEDLVNKIHIYNITVFNPQYFTDNEKIGFSVIDEQYKNDIRSGRAFVTIFYPYEGYPGTPGNRDFEIVEKWREEALFPKNSVHIITGNLIAEDDPVVKKSGIVVHPFCPFEDWNANVVEEPLVDFKPVDDKYLFVSYNRNARYPRVFLGSKFLEYGLWDKGLISMGKPEWLESNNIMRIEGVKDNEWMELNHRLPATLDANLHFNLACNINMKDHEHTFCSVVTETLVEEGTMFLSEKIFKPMQVGHPFFVLGNRGTLAFLRDRGYHTFGEWWDESYDGVDDYRIRAEMIAKELKKLSEKSKEELAQIRIEMRDVIVHNKIAHCKALIDNWGYKQTQKPLAVLDIFHKLYKKLENGQNFM